MLAAVTGEDGESAAPQAGKLAGHSGRRYIEP